MYDMDLVNKVVDYFNTHDTTVRKTAKHFYISKSSVYVYLTKVKPNSLSRIKLDYNKSQRHIRGGEATKNKYLMMKEFKTR